MSNDHHPEEEWWLNSMNLNGPPPPGTGLQIFTGLEIPLYLKLVEIKVFPRGIVAHTYSVVFKKAADIYAALLTFSMVIASPLTSPVTSTLSPIRSLNFSGLLMVYTFFPTTKTGL